MTVIARVWPGWGIELDEWRKRIDKIKVFIQRTDRDFSVQQSLPPWAQRMLELTENFSFIFSFFCFHNGPRLTFCSFFKVKAVDPAPRRRIYASSKSCWNKKKPIKRRVCWTSSSVSAAALRCRLLSEMTVTNVRQSVTGWFQSLIPRCHLLVVFWILLL